MNQKSVVFRHENVSQDSEFQFPPQLAKGRNPLLPKTLGVKQARATAYCIGGEFELSGLLPRCAVYDKMS